MNLLYRKMAYRLRALDYKFVGASVIIMLVVVLAIQLYPWLTAPA